MALQHINELGQQQGGKGIPAVEFCAQNGSFHAGSEGGGLEGWGEGEVMQPGPMTEDFGKHCWSRLLCMFEASQLCTDANEWFHASHGLSVRPAPATSATALRSSTPCSRCDDGGVRSSRCLPSIACRDVHA